MDWSLVTNFFIALLAIANPIGKVPLWVEMSARDVRGVRWRLAVRLTLSGLGLLLLFLVAGKHILSFFGIDLANFRIGGGIVLLLVGIKMFYGTVTQVDDEEEGEAPEDVLAAVRARFSELFIPLAVPMIAGPGAITTVLIYGSRAEGWVEYAALCGVVTVVCLLILVTLIGGHRLEQWTGMIAMKVQTRIFGLILIAIAVQFIVEGLGTVFPAWVTPASPIQDGAASQL